MSHESGDDALDQNEFLMRKHGISSHEAFLMQEQREKEVIEGGRRMSIERARQERIEEEKSGRVSLWS